MSQLFTAEQLDAVVDRAARFARATVAVFAAAPSADWAGGDGGAVSVEFAVEFFITPPSLQEFCQELEGQLLRLSSPYAAGRVSGAFGPVILHPVPAGTFHQWRYVFGVSESSSRSRRWGRDRAMVESVIRQGRIGWRELVG